MTKRLIDTDGALSTATKGTLVVGDGVTALSDGWYVVSSVLSSGSGLPTGIEVGYPFYADDGFTPEVGEDVYPITFSRLCDIQNVKLTFSGDELDVTVLCDDVKFYRKGRVDASGTFDGVTTLGITDVDDGFLNKFITKVKQSADLSTATISKIDNSPVYMQLEINKESTDGEDVAFFFFPASIQGTDAGVSIGSSQTFSGSFRMTPDDDIKPVLFELGQPVV